MASVELTDIIAVETLQKIQDAFSEMTGFAALTTDRSGHPVTKGSHFTEYCMEHIRKNELGCKNCELCDRYGAETTMRTGHATTYTCHSGLVDFSAPIVVEGELIGCFIGGQALANDPDPSEIKQVAQNLNMDFGVLWQSIQKVTIRERHDIDAGAEFLVTISQVLSDMAYGKYMALKSAEEMERVANMKSDFLANMSHEIRTPMNAVIGLAEMSLREDLPVVARDYINQIKNSGRSLLNIINDILDFSKIESGKMEIIPVDYESLSIMNDVANIVLVKLKDKEDVELLLDVDPTFPHTVNGDNNRIKQILINLANNAVKFTEHGHVKISLQYDTIDEENIMMKFFVEDTGIGIKEEDIDKLFGSFSQVDSKRNRNVEGTGLGLAITKNLLALMDGSVNVQSVYEKGSTFSFQLPQKVVDKTNSIEVKNPEKFYVIGYLENQDMTGQLFDDLGALGVAGIGAVNEDRLNLIVQGEKDSGKGRDIIIFTDKDRLDSFVTELAENDEKISVIVLTDFFDDYKSDHQAIRVLKKPMSPIVIAKALNGEEMDVYDSGSEAFEIDFTAPKAEILIVDDNSINLTVAEGLLEPLDMKIYTASGGKEAIDLVSKKKFDLIFMDHMMPEMDGVETTRVIRRMYPNYNDVPIIALTANAVDGTKEMFLSEGMNDFVGKPIEVKVLVSKVKQWLPVEKIVKGAKVVSEEDQKSAMSLKMDDLDVVSAINLLGNQKLFETILKEYYKNIPVKFTAIKNFFDAKDWPNYTIEVHALKSSSKQIGAMELSEMAAEMEKAGNARDTEKIEKNTMPMLQKYANYLQTLAPFCAEAEVKKEDLKTADPEALNALFDQMNEADENLDMDLMEETVGAIAEYYFEGEQAELLKQLQEASEGMDVDACDEIIGKWRELLK